MKKEKVYVIGKFEEELLEPELRPEYVEKLQRIEKFGKFNIYNSIEELRKHLDNA